MGTWTKDVGLAFRGLSKRPGFSTLVVLMLGGGVGAATALFSVFRTVFGLPEAFARLDIDRYPHLPAATVQRTSPASYNALISRPSP